MIINSLSKSIHLNVAFEEYLLKQRPYQKKNILFFWCNDRNVVIGRHQNPWKECQLQMMKQEGVVLARRKTGGGAVYQDLGNLCFTFISPLSQNGKNIDYKHLNNQILINSLAQLNINAEASGRNDLIVGSRKFSGSAYQLKLNKENPLALHHGTMMVSVDLNNLTKYLTPSKHKLISKGIDSVQSRVINLKEINPLITKEKIIKEMSLVYETLNGSCNHEELTEKQLLQIDFVKNQYEELKSDEWLLGQTPQFKDILEKKFNWALIEIQLKVEHGSIMDGQCYSDCLIPDFITSLNESIKEVQTTSYNLEGIQKILNIFSTKIGEDNEKIKMFQDLQTWLYDEFKLQ